MAVSSLVTFGEALIRYAPTGDSQSEPLHRPSLFLRSVGGDELNVCVALGRLGRHASWVSVVPEGPMGQIVLDSAKEGCADISDVAVVPNADMATFTVLPEKRTVHYQRRNSAFALHQPSLFDWPSLLSRDGPTWLHMTGITPMVASSPRCSWHSALAVAKAQGVRCSVDLNHRPQLGSLSELMECMRPHLKYLEVLVVSVDSLKGLATLEGVSVSAQAGGESESVDMMKAVRSKLGVKRLACCFKKVLDSSGLQRRWSVVCDETGGVHSTHDLPVVHRPRDQLGGGSAWMAGLLDYFMEHGLEGDMQSALRRADLLAALCQETAGDHSDVTRERLSEVEVRFAKREANFIEHLPNPAERVEETVELLRQAKIIAILRAKNADLAIARGLEMAELGVRAVEITEDTTDCFRVLRELSTRLPKDCILGIGTVMESSRVAEINAMNLGIRFALSPVNPRGFVAACHAHGIVGVPSAFTSNELWRLHSEEGARMLKLFHASLIPPSTLKGILGVGPLGAMNIMPSGGVTTEDVDKWLEAGAACIGMGSKFAGKDLAYQESDPQFAAAHEDWVKNGRPAVQALMQRLAAQK